MSGLLNSITGSLLGSSNLPSNTAMAACAAISSSTNILIENWPTNEYTSQYQTAQSHYWSNANADNTPACVAFPQNAQEVSEIVQVLLGYPGVGFAVKSGGHNANFGFSSTTGVLISMSNINSTTISSDRKSAVISPGATWAQTVTALEPYNVTVVGGRVGNFTNVTKPCSTDGTTGDVGVGGLLLGGGFSFLSAQYGLPCDNILNYEVVLSNGTVVDANPTYSSDLFWALKGGGNQFGIVTRFTVNTHPIGQVWGGYRTYSSAYADELLAATQNFTENYPDPAAALFTTCETLASNLDQFITVFYFYNGPGVPAGVFDKFLALPFTSDQTSTQSFSSLLTVNAGIASQYGLRYSLRAATIPNLSSQNGVNLMVSNYNNWISYITSQGLGGTTFIFTLIYQPMMTAIPAATLRANPLGNPFNLSTNYGDQMWMAATVAWISAQEDTSAHSMIMTIMNNVESYAKSTYPNDLPSNFPAGGDMEHVYAPAYFMNDAMYDQRVLQGYGTASYQRLQTIQKAYDPIGFFNRTGGFKFT